MKKICLIILLLLIPLFLLLASGQPQAGFKAGINSGHLEGFAGNGRQSFHAGVFVHYTLNKQWHFQPELIYSGQTQRYIPNELEKTLSIGYVELPLMIQYFPMRQFYLECGPQVGVLTHAIDKGEGENKLNVKRSFRNFNFGLDIGLGFLVSKRLNVYGRYDLGLTDITPFDNSMVQNRVAQLGLALRFK